MPTPTITLSTMETWETRLIVLELQGDNCMFSLSSWFLFWTSTINAHACISRVLYYDTYNWFLWYELIWYIIYIIITTIQYRLDIKWFIFIVMLSWSCFFFSCDLSEVFLSVASCCQLIDHVAVFFPPGLVFALCKRNALSLQSHTTQRRTCQSPSKSHLSMLVNFKHFLKHVILGLKPSANMGSL